MAVKYAWKNSLLIADTADDPDANINTRVYKSTPTSKEYEKAFLEVKAELDAQQKEVHGAFINKRVEEKLAKTGSRLSRAAEMAKAPF